MFQVIYKHSTVEEPGKPMRAEEVEKDESMRIASLRENGHVTPTKPRECGSGERRILTMTVRQQ